MIGRERAARTGDVLRSNGTVANEADSINEDGSINVRVLSGGGGGGSDPIPPADVTLQNAASAIGNGTPFTVGSYKTLTLEVTGTSTSRTVIWEAQSVSGAWYAIQGVRMSDYSMATQTTGSGEIWQFDITGLAAIRARISAVAGGNVSVRGKAVV